MTQEQAVEKARKLCADRGVACWTVRIERDGRVLLGMGFRSTESARRACEIAASYAEHCGAPCEFVIVTERGMSCLIKKEKGRTE